MFSRTLPTERNAVFEDKYSYILGIRDAISTMEQSLSRAFGRSGMVKLKYIAFRLIRAAELSEQMISVGRQIEEALYLIRQLKLALANELKIQEHRDALLAELEKLRLAEATIISPWQPFHP